jgi:hypothetical protein
VVSRRRVPDPGKDVSGHALSHAVRSRRDYLVGRRPCSTRSILVPTPRSLGHTDQISAALRCDATSLRAPLTLDAAATRPSSNRTSILKRPRMSAPSDPSTSVGEPVNLYHKPWSPACEAVPGPAEGPGPLHTIPRRIGRTYAARVWAHPATMRVRFWSLWDASVWR